MTYDLRDILALMTAVEHVRECALQECADACEGSDWQECRDAVLGLVGKRRIDTTSSADHWELAATAMLQAARIGVIERSVALCERVRHAYCCHYKTEPSSRQ